MPNTIIPFLVIQSAVLPDKIEDVSDIAVRIFKEAIVSGEKLVSPIFYFPFVVDRGGMFTVHSHGNIFTQSELAAWLAAKDQLISWIEENCLADPETGSLYIHYNFGYTTCEGNEWPKGHWPVASGTAKSHWDIINGLYPERLVGLIEKAICKTMIEKISINMYDNAILSENPSYEVDILRIAKVLYELIQPNLAGFYQGIK